jgi:hypothetical protein
MSAQVPSAYPFMAILISQSKSIFARIMKCYDHDEESGTFDFLGHFRGRLGDDMEFELARKLCEHVRLLAAEVVTKSEKKLRKLTNNEDDGDEEYQWLLFRLRNFVTAYSQLDAFFAAPEYTKWRKRGGELRAVDGKPHWPRVCLIVATFPFY